VCGSGNLAVASLFPQDSYTARQGSALGRDGRVFVKRDKDAIWLGGSCVTCVDGEISA
jgi:predicted PhzF superfamily epimerase YddE/YHI9